MNRKGHPRFLPAPLLAAAAFLAAPPASCHAAEPPAAERRGLLAGLPSAPGPHIEKVKALGDGQWLNLGAPAPDPKWGVAPGRSYSPRMPFAPDLGGAFLYGEGKHAGFRADGYVQDDLWFYDFNAHRWICCYPGTNSKGAGLKLNANGCFQDKDGQVVPVTVMHGWEQISYDPDRGEFAAMTKGSYFSLPKIQGLEYSGRDGEGTPYSKLSALNAKGSPWLWNTRTGRWHREPCDGPEANFAHHLLYVPSLKQFWYRGRDAAVSLYDPAKKVWEAFKPEGPPPPFGIAGHCVYDPKRDRVYLGGGWEPEPPDTESLWIYDVKGRKWSNAKAANSTMKSYVCNWAVVNFDTVNDRMLVFVLEKNGTEKNVARIAAYDPGANRWDDPVPSGFAVKGLNRAWNGFYDPANNVHVFHAAGDSVTNGVICAYRYRRGPAGQK